MSPPSPYIAQAYITQLKLFVFIRDARQRQSSAVLADLRGKWDQESDCFDLFRRQLACRRLGVHLEA